jgi:hypothetical protein
MLVPMLRLAVIVIALCACRDEQLQKVKAVRDEVCACKDVACGEEAIKKLPQKDIKPNHHQQKLASEMMTCLSKLYLKDRPQEDPDEVLDTGSASPPPPPP